MIVKPPENETSSLRSPEVREGVENLEDLRNELVRYIKRKFSNLNNIADIAEVTINIYLTVMSGSVKFQSPIFLSESAGLHLMVAK